MIERFQFLLRSRLEIGGQVTPPRELIEAITQEEYSSFDIEDTQRRGELIDYLSQGKRVLEQAEGKVPSRPFLCSYLIIHALEEQTLQNAIEHLAANDFVRFSVAFDLAAGMGHTLSVIAAAEAEVEGSFGQLAAEVISDLSEITTSVPMEEQSETFIRSQKDTVILASKLKNDPSGFSLINHVVNDLEQNWGQFPGSRFHHKEVFIAGAKTAQAMYKAIYPLTENLPD